VGESLSDWAVWSVVEQSAREIGIEKFGAHDLRRTCAKLCRKAGDGLFSFVGWPSGSSLIRRLSHAAISAQWIATRRIGY
jgi:hypothetical protein